MDKISLTGIKAYGRHGVLAEEAVLGQPFIVDIDLYLDLSAAAISDNLEATINYADIFAIVVEEISQKQYKLIETLAYTILKRCLAYDAKIMKIAIDLHKPQAPLFGEFETATVSMERSRNECDLS